MFNIAGSEELSLLTSLQSGRRGKTRHQTVLKRSEGYCSPPEKDVSEGYPFRRGSRRNLWLVCNSFEAVELNVHSWRAAGFAVLRPDCNGDLRTKTENVCWQVWMEKLESSLKLPAADFLVPLT